jgi:hypothetical protein
MPLSLRWSWRSGVAIPLPASRLISQYEMPEHLCDRLIYAFADHTEDARIFRDERDRNPLRSALFDTLPAVTYWASPDVAQTGSVCA